MWETEENGIRARLSPNLVRLLSDDTSIVLETSEIGTAIQLLKTAKHQLIAINKWAKFEEKMRGKHGVHRIENSGGEHVQICYGYNLTIKVNDIHEPWEDVDIQVLVNWAPYLEKI